jgi:hypothetical protein
MNKFNGLAIKNTEKWLEKAHLTINENFEEALTASLKKTYL